jgi:hypothetical protein
VFNITYKFLICEYTVIVDFIFCFRALFLLLLFRNKVKRGFYRWHLVRDKCRF